MLLLTHFKKDKGRGREKGDRCMSPISSPNLLFIHSVISQKYVQEQ